MRSNHLIEFRNQLAELNNCFSHYIFVWEQFYIDNDKTIKADSNKFTTTIYPTNPNSRQFNVQLQHLDNSHQETYNFILKSLFLLTYSQFEVYMRTFYEFARKADSSLPNLTVKERVPDDIFIHLGLDISKQFDQKEVWTFDYLRLRRNRITHSGGQSKGELAELIRQRGNALQACWTTKLTNGLFGINFQSHDTDNFAKEEVFDLINIWRALTDKIDEIICLKIGKESIILNLQKEFETTNKSKIKMWGDDRSKNKFGTYCKINFDISLSSDELKKVLFNGVVA